MTIAVWIVSGIVALAFLGSGVQKVARSKAALQPMMGYVDDLKAWQVKAIGAVEILGAIGLIVPALTGIAPILSAFAAVGLAIVMIVAFALHVKRGEQQRAAVINGALFVGAVFIAVGRFLGF